MFRSPYNYCVKSPYWIFSFDQNVVDGRPIVSINILGDKKLSRVWIDLEKRMFFLTVKAIRQGVEQSTKLRAVSIRGNNLK